MLCLNPFIRDPSGKVLKAATVGNPELALRGIPFPCGQCLPCRINRRRRWTARLMMELLDHEAARFYTLTYTEECLPEHGFLSKRDVQLFLKRLRKALKRRRIRYYACGEYGPLHLRPHYHCIIFGVSDQDDSLVERCWSLGGVRPGTAEHDSIQYVAGYVTKKLGSRIDGCLPPEFSLMSRRPPLGHTALKALAVTLQKPDVAKHFNELTEIPVNLRFGSYILPLDRTSRGIIGKVLNHDWDKSTAHFILEQRIRYISARRCLPASDTPLIDLNSIENKEKVRQIEARFKIFSSRD